MITKVVSNEERVIEPRRKVRRLARRSVGETVQGKEEMMTETGAQELTEEREMTTETEAGERGAEMTTETEAGERREETTSETEAGERGAEMTTETEAGERREEMTTETKGGEDMVMDEPEEETGGEEHVSIEHLKLTLMSL